MSRDEAKWVLELIRDRYSSVDVDRLSLTDAETDAIDMAIEALEEAKKREETWEWCTDCKEYDQENHCCHRFSKRIWESVEEMKLERQHGEWMYLYEDNYKCSICGSWWCCTDSQIEEMNYCPNCGSYNNG